MIEENKTLEEICFEFQQRFLDIFNEEQKIPFLLKYYLTKEIWESIEKHKIEIDMQVKSNIRLPKKVQTLDLQTGETTIKEIENEEDLTN